MKIIFFYFLKIIFHIKILKYLKILKTFNLKKKKFIFFLNIFKKQK